MHPSREIEPPDISEYDFASVLMPPEKRAKLASARVLDADDVEKRPQMVMNDDLLCFIAHCILADLET